MLHGPNSPNPAPPFVRVKLQMLYKQKSKLNQLKLAKNTKGQPFCNVNPHTNTHVTKGMRRVAGIRSGIGMTMASVKTMVNDELQQLNDM
jgi:hypothetical protein